MGYIVSILTVSFLNSFSTTFNHQLINQLINWHETLDTISTAEIVNNFIERELICLTKVPCSFDYESLYS